MTGTVFDIRRFSTHDGEGIRTTVFMKGCPLRCVWCHNPEGIDTRSRPLFFQDRCIGCGTCRRLAKEGGMRLVEGRLRLDVSKEEDWDGLIEACPAGAIVRDSRVMTAEQVAVEAMRDAPFYKSGGGVTFSGGEPLLQAGFVAEVLKELKRNGIHTAIETALHVPLEAVELTVPLLDQIYADLKLMDPAAHKRATGASNEQIKKNLEWLLRSPKRGAVTVRTPMIPGMTDSDDNIAEIARSISKIYPEVTYELLNHNPLAQAKYHLVDREYYRKEAPGRYSKEQMAHFAEVARENGVRDVRVG